MSEMLGDFTRYVVASEEAPSLSVTGCQIDSRVDGFSATPQTARHILASGQRNSAATDKWDMSV
jgi:hypothetical protein